MLFQLDRSQPLVLLVFADAAYANAEGRKSTTGFAIWLQNCLLALGSKTQATVALSVAEAELLALCTAAADALFLQSFLRDMEVEVSIEMFTDSSSAIGILSREGALRVKHLDVELLWLQS